MDIKGKIHEIGVTTNVTETFKRREVIVEYSENPQYPEYIKFELIQDKTGIADSFKVGDEVEVFFNLRGRPWSDKNGKTTYFNTLVIWRMNKLVSENKESQFYPSPLSPITDDDLPFG